MDQTNEIKNSNKENKEANSGTNVVKKSISRVKTAFTELTPSKKRIVAISAAVLVGIVVIITIALNASGGKYTELYSDLSTSESSSVYQALLSMGADAKIGKDGSVLVPEDEYDIWILQLASKGYPKTALPYDVFSSHTGMTATESEKAQWLLYQLQDRIQATLERMDSVDSATVTINIPESSDYVWDKATNEESSSAGVLLTLREGSEISDNQVSAICTLVASSVPKMKPEDVTVVDASTMLNLSDNEVNAENSSNKNLEFELMVQDQIEKNVVRLLTPRFGKGGVVAVAKATIDYDKMMTEKYELVPNSDDEGFLTEDEGHYTVNGDIPAGDVVGEENNTDIPSYAYKNPNDDNGMTDYDWDNKYDYGYLKTQIESGNAILNRATVSVMVNYDGMTPNLRKELCNLISGCTDIPTEQIFVSTFQVETGNKKEETESNNSMFNLDNLPVWAYFAIAGFFLLLILVIILIVVLKRRKKKKEALASEEADKKRKEEQARMKNEIEDYKRSLEDMAKGNIDPKDEAIIKEVRSFAKSNPEVTANLLRSWLEEGE